MFKVMNDNPNAQENVFAGIVGAFLFSLAGGVVWFLLWQVGYVAAISGIVGVVCAIKGYSVFGKKESIKGVIISVIITIAVMVLAWYLCLSLDVYNAYKDWYAEGFVDFTISFGEAVRNAHLFLEEPEISGEYVSSLAMGLVFCVIGGVGYVISSIKRVKVAKESAKPMNASAPEYNNSTQYNDDAFIGEGHTQTRLNGEADDLKDGE